MIILFVRVQSSTGMILQVWQEWVTDSVFEVQFHKVLWKWDFCVILCFSVINAESCQKAAAFAAVSVGVRACCYCFYLMVFYTSGYGYFMLISYRWAPVCYLAHVLDWFAHIVKLLAVICFSVHLCWSSSQSNGTFGQICAVKEKVFGHYVHGSVQHHVKLLNRFC